MIFDFIVRRIEMKIGYTVLIIITIVMIMPRYFFSFYFTNLIKTSFTYPNILGE